MTAQGQRTEYVPLEKAGDHRRYYEHYWSDKDTAIQRVISLFKPLDTPNAEIIATLYTAWNDLLLSDKQPDDDEILHEATENWHEAKKGIARQKWIWGLTYLRENDLLPRGTGHMTKSAPAPATKRPRQRRVMQQEPKDLKLVSPPATNQTLDIGLGEVTNDLTARVRVNGKLGVLIADTPTGDGRSLIMVQYDGEAKPRTFYSPPAVVQRLAD